MRTIQTTVFTLLALVICGAAAAQTARVALHIDAQPMRLALKDLGEQTGLQIMFRAEDVATDQMTAPRIAGELSAREALEKMLAKSGLKYRFVNPNTVLISAQDAAKPEKTAWLSGTGAVRLAQAESSAGDSSASAGQEQVTEGAGEDLENMPLDEVLVTAQKRIERLQDVPVPVTALNTQTLVENNQLRLQDYFTKVPGLSLNLIGGSEAGASLSIRGLTMGGNNNPTVSMVIDEIPYGTTVSTGNELTMADIDPGDLARIEVLRGPQGTLYGASSIGGLIKFTTLDPSTDRLSGRVQVGTSSVKEGDDLGYNVRGAVSVPLGDTFAVRASAFTLRDPGFIDNVFTGEEDINERESRGGRVTGLWRPSENLSLKLSALVQDSERSGPGDVYVLPGFGEWDNGSVPGTGSDDRKTEAYAMTLRAKLGKADLISATGFSVDDVASPQDVSATPFGSFVAPLIFGDGEYGAVDYFSRTVEKLTQEVRVSFPVGERFEWLVGGFYTREKVKAIADFWALEPASGARIGQLASSDTPDNQFEEYAAFTDLTVHFTDRFDVQFGGRISHNEQSFFLIRSGPLISLQTGEDSVVTETAEAKESPFTYLVTPRFKVSPDTMLYARFASGYRPAALNLNCGVAPCKSDSDTTQNYEIGIKGSLLDHAFTYDASVYYIDWKDIQLDLLTPDDFFYTGNAGTAKSQGIELSIESRPLTGLLLSGWVSWNEAELTEDFPDDSSFIGFSGDQLPYGAKFTGNLSVDQEFPLWGTATGAVGGSVSYVGERRGVFLDVPDPRQVFPAYTQVDLHAALKYDTWSVNAFVNNVTDKRALIGGGTGNFIPFIFNYTQPRTIGLSLTKTF